MAAIVAAAASLRAVRQEAAEAGARLSALVDRIRARVPELIPDVEVVGDPVRRLPHMVTFSCLYVSGEALLTALDRAGFAVSSGSSCTSSTLTPSHVLRAMGVLSEGNVRVSLPFDTSADDVEQFLAALPGVVSGVRERFKLAVAPQPAAAPLGAPDLGEPVRVMNTLGRRCPIPVMELAKHIGDLPPGAVAAVVSDDEAARLDIPAWCEMRGQEYLGERPAPGDGTGRGIAYLVRRVAP